MLCRERWTALHPAVTQLVTTMVDERYYWEDSVVRVLPHLEALTLVATGCQLASSDGPSVVPRANELEDLYVESLPGRAPAPYALLGCRTTAPPAA